MSTQSKLQELQAHILNMKLKTPYHPDLQGLIMQYSEAVDAKQAERALQAKR